MQSFSDFISKSFKFGHSVKTVNKSSGGVKIENGASPSGGALKSYTKVNFPAGDFGDAEVQITANGAADATNAKIEFGQLVKGVDTTLSADSSPNVCLELGYSPVANVGTKFEINTDLDSSKKLKASVNAASNGVKATVDTNICLSGGGLTDYNFKLDYKQKNLLASAKTSKGRSQLTANVCTQMCAGFYAGAQLEHNLKDSSSLVTVGTKNKLDDTTSVSQMVDSNGVLSTAIEHKLTNPAMKINAAAQFNLFGSAPCTAQKFGLGLTFGDY